MKSISLSLILIQFIFFSMNSFSQAVKLKAPSEDMYAKDAVVQIFLPAQADVALMLDKHFENKNYGAWWKKDEEGKIVIRGFTEFAKTLHRTLLENGFHPSSYYSYDGGMMTEEDKKIVYDESKRTADFLFSYMINVIETNGVISATHNLLITKLNGDESLFNTSGEYFAIHGSSLRDVFLRVDKKIKKAKRTKPTPVSYYEPILLSEDALVGEVYDVVPDDLDKLTLHLQMTKVEVPEGAKGIVRKLLEEGVIANEIIQKRRKAQLDSTEFKYISHPGWDKVKNPTKNDYYIGVVTSSQKNRYITISLGAGAGVGHGSEIVTYVYFYLKNALTNDIYTFDYGDFQDDDLSFVTFIAKLVTEREKQ